MKKTEVGMLVSVPDRMCYPGRRDPYEWENGIVTAVDGEKVKVKVKRYISDKTSYEKWFPLSWAVKKVSYSHERGEEEKFMKWVEQERVI